MEVEDAIEGEVEVGERVEVGEGMEAELLGAEMLVGFREAEAKFMLGAESATEGETGGLGGGLGLLFVKAGLGGVVAAELGG